MIQEGWTGLVGQRIDDVVVSVKEAKDSVDGLVVFVRVSVSPPSPPPPPTPTLETRIPNKRRTS